MKQKFDIIESSCIPLPLENVDTDQIIPARFLKAVTRDEKMHELVNHHVLEALGRIEGEHHVDADAARRRLTTPPS